MAQLTSDHIARHPIDLAGHGLRWNVVESLPIHERIKLNEGDLTELFDNYRQSMRNLAAARSGFCERMRSAMLPCVTTTAGWAKSGFAAIASHAPPFVDKSGKSMTMKAQGWDMLLKK